MKRKAIQLAGRTLVLSLPSKWVKENNIQKGDELDIQPNKESLTISSDKEPAKKTVQIDISGVSYSTAWHYLTSAYCNGFEEIELIFQPTIRDSKNNKFIKTADAILKITDGLIGVEIVKQKKNSCIIKEISKIQKDEFHNMLRRLFYLILSIAEDSYEALKNQDKNALKNILLLETNVNKFSHYCLRTLKFFENKDLAFIIRALEMISDKYCFLVKNTNLKNKELEAFKQMNTLLKEFHEVFYTLNILKFNNFHNKLFEFKKVVLKNALKNKDAFIDILELTIEALNAKLFLEN